MAIDHELRKSGIGASEVAVALGLSPYQTPFDLYVRKLGLVDEQPSTAVQRRGKYFERGVIDWYSDITGRKTEWWDKTIFHPDRPWQMASPDAWIIENDCRVAEAQAKTVGWRSLDEYGEPGTDDVPTHCHIQSQWTMSTANTQYGDLAALLGMDELAIYRIWRDADIEAVLVDEVDKFWRHHVLARVPPDIGGSSLAGAYIKKRFPRNVEPLRTATPDEHELLSAVKAADEQWTAVNALCETLDNRLRLAIGDADGLLDGTAKITYRLSKDSCGVDWEAMAKEAIRELTEMHVEQQYREAYVGEAVPAGMTEKAFQGQMVAFIRKHTKVLAAGGRRLSKNWQACGKPRRRK